MTVHGQRGDIARTAADVVRAGAAATPLTGVLVELWKIPTARRERRWRFFLDELLLAWDLELEDLWQAVSDERVHALLEHAQRVAETTRSDDKTQLAARIVASVLHGERSDERVETANVLLQLIEPLEAHHVEVFTVVSSPRPAEGQLAGQTVVGGWTMTDLQDRLAHMRDLVPVIVAALTSAGLIIDSGVASVTYGGLGRHQLGPTAAGTWLLARLAEVEPPAPLEGS